MAAALAALHSLRPWGYARRANEKKNQKKYARLNRTPLPPILQTLPSLIPPLRRRLHRPMVVVVSFPFFSRAVGVRAFFLKFSFFFT